MYILLLLTFYLFNWRNLELDYLGVPFKAD
jgi:hypothetical protein